MADNLPAPDWFHPDKIIAHYIEGQSTEDVAKRLGVSESTLRYHLTTRSPDQWKWAVAIKALKREAEAEDEIDKAPDMLQLRKAEVKLKSAQWSLERVLRPIYGQDAPKDTGERHTIMINIGIARPGDAAKVINQDASSKVSQD